MNWLVSNRVGAEKAYALAKTPRTPKNPPDARWKRLTVRIIPCFKSVRLNSASTQIACWHGARSLMRQHLMDRLRDRGRARRMDTAMLTDFVFRDRKSTRMNSSH